MIDKVPINNDQAKKVANTNVFGAGNLLECARS